MKFLKAIVITVFVIMIILFIAVFLIIKTVDINDYKEQITERISSSFGRKVSLDNVDLKMNLKSGLVLGVHQIRVADSPSFGSGDILSVQSVKLNVDIMAFIIQREIKITKIEVQSPKILMAVNQKGENNWVVTDSEEKVKKSTASPKSDFPVSNNGESSLPKPIEIPSIIINSIKIIDGEVLFEDNSEKEIKKIEIGQINFSASNVTLNEFFRFRLSCSVLSAKENVSINGELKFDQVKALSFLREINLSFDIAATDLRKVEELLGVDSLGVGESVNGSLDILIFESIIDEQGLKLLIGSGELSIRKVVLADLAIPIENIYADFKFDAKDMDLSDLSFNFAGGKISMTAQLNDYLNTRKYHSSMKVEAVQISELLSVVEMPFKLEGKFFSKLDVDAFFANPDQINNSIHGQGTGSLQEGKIVDLNILRFVLSQISILPNLVEKIESNLPDHIKEKLKRNYTVISDAQLTHSIADEKLHIENLTIVADEFLLTMKGQVGFDLMAHINSKVVISKDLSAAMVNSATELRGLLDENSQISIPLMPFHGDIKNFKPFPNLEYIGKRIIQTKGKDELRRVIFKALDLEVEEAQPASEGSNPQDKRKEVRPEQILIDGILDAIFN